MARATLGTAVEWSTIVIAIDDKYWPLVVFRFEGTVTMAELEGYLKRQEADIGAFRRDEDGFGASSCDGSGGAARASPVGIEIGACRDAGGSAGVWRTRRRSSAKSVAVV